MTPKTTTIIVEDDSHAVEYLTNSLSIYKNRLDILGHATSILEAVKLIERSRPELVFMDIELKDGLSFTIFEHLAHHDFEVIFITGHSSFLQRAMEHYALSYVIKPYKPEQIHIAVDRYLKLKERLYSKQKYDTFSSFIQQKETRFLLHIGNEHVSVKTNDIVKCVSDGNYTLFHLNDGKEYLASHSLKYYEELLIDKGFFRPNRSVLINNTFIASIYKKETIVLHNSEKIHVSVRNKSKLGLLIDSLS